MSKTYTQTARQQIHSESSPSSSTPQLMSQFDVCWPADWLLNRGTSSESRFAYEFVHSLIVEQNLLLLPQFAFSFTLLPATAISSHYLEGPPPPTLKSNQQLQNSAFRQFGHFKITTCLVVYFESPPSFWLLLMMMMRTVVVKMMAAVYYCK